MLWSSFIQVLFNPFDNPWRLEMSLLNWQLMLKDCLIVIDIRLFSSSLFNQTRLNGFRPIFWFPNFERWSFRIILFSLSLVWPKNVISYWPQFPYHSDMVTQSYTGWTQGRWNHSTSTFSGVMRLTCLTLHATEPSPQNHTARSLKKCLKNAST